MSHEIANPEAPAVAFLPRRQAALITPSRRHSRKCTVCHHPFRHLIELSFLRWSSPSLLARRFGINNRATIYHHAHATHLFELRQVLAHQHPTTKQREYSFGPTQSQ